MSRAMAALIAILSLMSFQRGLDYLTGNTIDRGPLWDDNLTLPVVWGIACMLVAVLGITAAVRMCPLLGQWAGIFGMAVNAMFAVQVFEPHMLPVPWPPEDARFVSDHLGHASMWWLIAVTLWWRAGISRRVAEKLAADRKANG